MDLSFYDGKKVFITGHNGFKGTWMCKVLKGLGAEVLGYSLHTDNEYYMSNIIDLNSEIEFVDGNIRNLNDLEKAMKSFEPDVVIHMAAQPIVRESYKDPVGTYATNVMGTVNLMESIRRCDSVKSVINVTTDKVYRNNEWERGYKEDDFLDGYDPYANSKSCSELVTASYKRSFLDDKGVSVTTCRAGNVIGGGDYAPDRIVPDCVRASTDNRTIVLRNPGSIRPYQHVLEPVCAYLMIAAKQYENKEYAGNYNIGPADIDCVTTQELVKIFCDKWKGAKWEAKPENNAPHESYLLKLDCTKVRETFGWDPKWHIADTVEKTVDWYKEYNDKKDMSKYTDLQIKEYLS